MLQPVSAVGIKIYQTLLMYLFTSKDDPMFKRPHLAFDPSHVSGCLTSRSVMCRCVIRVLHYQAERRKHMLSDLLVLLHDNTSWEWKCHLSLSLVWLCVRQYIWHQWQNKWQFSDDFIASLNSLRKSNLGGLCIHSGSSMPPIFPNAHLLLAGKTDWNLSLSVFWKQDKLTWSKTVLR